MIASPVLAPAGMAGAIVPYGTTTAAGAYVAGATGPAVDGRTLTVADMLAAQQNVPTHDAQGRLVTVSPFHTANGHPILHLSVLGQEAPAPAAAAGVAAAPPTVTAARPPAANPYQHGPAATDPVARMLEFVAPRQGPLLSLLPHLLPKLPPPGCSTSCCRRPPGRR